ncbi:unnamed protein product [Paramecium sonneborni]|uniref:Uncharacterized protein n=1 Tax=Paramecium sonneborni TaxID=65129 RepID=A0A8S1RQ80_9CILI|nr:unnamed protein product [Paramecium sonneborni]
MVLIYRQQINQIKKVVWIQQIIKQLANEQVKDVEKQIKYNFKQQLIKQIIQFTYIRLISVTSACTGLVNRPTKALLVLQLQEKLIVQQVQQPLQRVFQVEMHELLQSQKVIKSSIVIQQVCNISFVATQSNKFISNKSAKAVVKNLLENLVNLLVVHLQQNSHQCVIIISQCAECYIGQKEQNCFLKKSCQFNEFDQVNKENTQVEKPLYQCNKVDSSYQYATTGDGCLQVQCWFVQDIVQLLLLIAQDKECLQYNNPNLVHIYVEVFGHLKKQNMCIK